MMKEKTQQNKLHIVFALFSNYSFCGEAGEQ